MQSRAHIRADLAACPRDVPLCLARATRCQVLSGSEPMVGGSLLFKI